MSARSFGVKAIQGDFSRLVEYKPVYSHDDSVNFFALLGFSFGNDVETELLGKIREGMQDGDYLLLDARLHDFGPIDRPLTKAESDKLTYHYNHGLTKQFAFGPLEAVTNADIRVTTMGYDVGTTRASVPGSFNVSFIVPI
ncbi:hypothetical protein MEX01_54720 [Methylorubrum extorquens]|nr:hypothetical protein MEX01_54720 [Methylorubrum extorquens]